MSKLFDHINKEVKKGEKKGFEQFKKAMSIDLVGEYGKICVGCKHPDPSEECEMWQLDKCVGKWVKDAQPRIDKQRIEYAIEVLDRCLRKKGTLDMVQKSDITGEISELRKQLAELKELTPRKINNKPLNESEFTELFDNSQGPEHGM